MPMPLLTTTLDTIFNRFQSPYISLLSSPVMAAVAAGVRSALVVDLGWAETVVTSVYEFREVRSSSSLRAGRMLIQQVHKLLARALDEREGDTRHENTEETQDQVVSFEECEEVASRMLWCKPVAGSHQDTPPDGLPTVTETDESEAGTSGTPEKTDSASIRLSSPFPPTTVDISYDGLAEPCEAAFFETQYSAASWDDDELPVPLLLYHHLLRLPLDVRAICMSRIIFTGGCANVLGLRGRISDELSNIVQARGWDPVAGKAPEQLKTNPKLQRREGGRRGATAGDPSRPTLDPGGDVAGEQDGVWHDAANAAPEKDPVEEQFRKVQGVRDTRPIVQGQLRAIESLGPWSGASLVTQLKMPAIATIDRELWAQQGVAGASKPGEVDLKTTQRQSMGPGNLMRSAAAGTNWTLGAWGNV